MENVVKLFQEFLEDDRNHNELIYCLTQSSVEPTVRFKFGAWLSREYPSWFNALETKRIDLIIGDEKEIYFIEFGHCLNLLRHTPIGHIHKIENDFTKLTANKVSKFLEKYPKLVTGKSINKISITLFSDFKCVKNNNRYNVCFDDDKLTYGVFLKYGINQKDNEYFDSNSENYYNNKLISAGYNEKILIEGKLSLWWHITEYK